MKRWMGLAIAALSLNAQVQAAGPEARAPQAAPVMQALDLRGGLKTLADYRGKVVLLNFWATWCPPCRREMPSMEKLRQKMAGRPLEIVALDSAEAIEDVKAYLATQQLGFHILLDADGQNTRRWKVYALPTSFLLDTAGRIRFVLKGPAEWDEGEALQAIETLLAETAKTAGP